MAQARSKLISCLLLLASLSGCGLLNVDPYHYLIRSDVIQSQADHERIVSKGKLSWTSDGRIRVLYVSGTPYERGYQHGVLLRHEIQDNLNTLYKNALKTYRYDEIFEEVYERMRPFMPEEYVEEMHGLAHGAKVPLKLVHYMHVLPEMTEWGGKKRLKEIFYQMLKGAIVPSCSNLCALGSASKDRQMYSVRILDWGLHKISKLHQYPLITISLPERGYASANIGWVGFIGAVSGMNERGITLGEMGNGDTPNETLRGKTMPFLLRDILNYANSLKDVRRLIGTSPGTNSYGFLMTDGKSGTAEIYVRDPDRFLIFKPGENLKDHRVNLPGIKDIVYGGHFDEKMHEILTKHRGQLSPELLMNEIIPEIAMKSNFQNVIYDPKNLKFWVNNAKSPAEPAFSQPYTFFDFGQALRDLKVGSKK